MTKMICRIAGLALLALTPSTLLAQDALVTFKSLKPEYALNLAQTALEDCRNKGYQVGVAVVDRSGVLQVFLKDQYAGSHVQETATRKAWTAVSFRTDTLSLDEATRPDGIAAGIRMISQALPLGGGVPVEAAGSIVAGIGVSGAPGPDIDDECARAGIEEIQLDLDF